MPAVAVVGAVAAWSAVSTVGIITAIGATIGAVGAITGNKTLSMIGAGMSLVGGISSLASSAGSASGSVAGSVADVADDVAGAAAGGAAASSAPVVPQAVADTTNAVLNTGGAAMPAGEGMISQAMSAAPSAGSASAMPVGDFVKQGMGVADTSMGSGLNAAGAADITSMASPAASAGSAAAGSFSIIDKFLTFTKANPTLIDSGMKLVGGAMQGEFNQKFLDLKNDELDMKKEKQRWGNSVPDVTGMIGQSYKPNLTPKKA